MIWSADNREIPKPTLPSEDTNQAKEKKIQLDDSEGS